MACEFITDGRQQPCKDTLGGLEAVYFIDYDNMPSLDASDDVDGFSSAAFTAYKYELRTNSDLTQNINASRENGTVFFEQVLSLNLKKLTSADNKAIKLLSYGRPHIMVQDYNGNFWMVGAEFGADVTGGSAVTGVAMGDFNGYNLTFTAMERTLANKVIATDNGDGTITVGTDVITVDDGAVI